MKVIVAFSGGKDSQACLIWAVKKYGAENVTSVFCDTGWENPLTYGHINYVIEKLGVKHFTIKSKKDDGFINLAFRKKRFPSTNARFCTEELKAKPMIDFILDQQDNVLIIQGIRKDESIRRSKMAKQCTFFKYYFEPYGYDKKGKSKYHTYQKKTVIKFTNKYIDDVLRPIFYWTGKQTIEYIQQNGQDPNPLYKQGFSRVGCFPCIMCNQNEILQIINRYPEKIKEINFWEKILGHTFFPPNYIPANFCTEITKEGIKYPNIKDVVKYITNKNATLDMFNKPRSCMSFYGICE